MRMIRVSPLVLALSMLAHCSGTPADAAVEIWFKTHVEAESEGRLRVVSFTKTRSETLKLDGDHYILGYEAEIEVLESGFWYRDPITVRFQTWSTDQGRDPFVFALGVPMAKGEIRTIRQTLEFENQGLGWIGPDGSILQPPGGRDVGLTLPSRAFRDQGMDR